MTTRHSASQQIERTNHFRALRVGFELRDNFRSDNCDLLNLTNRYCYCDCPHSHHLVLWLFSDQSSLGLPFCRFRLVAHPPFAAHPINPRLDRARSDHNRNYQHLIYSSLRTAVARFDLSCIFNGSPHSKPFFESRLTPPGSRVAGTISVREITVHVITVLLLRFGIIYALGFALV